jgi:tRNA(His) guanylyltransferase
VAKDVKDPIGDRCKEYEMLEAGRKAMPGIPLMARLDGRAFHTFTRGLARPYDVRFSNCMIETMKALVEEFHPLTGYTQSDEISLMWLVPADSSSQYPFDGRFQKLTSVLSGYASAVFLREVQKNLPEKATEIPCFDARVWQVPSLQDAYDVFCWREADAVKNSITMAASAYYSHSALQGVGSSEKQELLHKKGVNWNNYPPFFKRGVYCQRQSVEKTLTEEERLRIPEKFRPAPDQLVTRTVIEIKEWQLRQFPPEILLKRLS